MEDDSLSPCLMVINPGAGSITFTGFQLGETPPTVYLLVWSALGAQGRLAPRQNLVFGLPSDSRMLSSDCRPLSRLSWGCPSQTSPPLLVLVSEISLPFLFVVLASGNT